MTTMIRGLMILGLALALTLFGLLMYAQSPAYGLPLTVGVALGVALCLRPFPKLRMLERGLPFAVLYVFTYFLASDLGLGRSPKSATLMMIAVLIGSVVCAFIVWSTLGQERQRDRLVCTLGMVGIGILTAFFSGPQGGAGKFMAFLLDVLHLTPDAATAVNFLLRKGMHLMVYAVLALSAAAVSRKQGEEKWWWLAGLSWGVPHAVLDEYTQSSTSVRTGSLWDVLLDVVGMAVALCIYHWKKVSKKT